MELIVGSNQEFARQSPHQELFPWNIVDHGDKEFWCQRLGNYVKLTPDIESNGTYYVKIIGSSSNRAFPVRGNEIVIAESKEAKRINIKENSGVFPINKSNWTQIKNFLCDDFINSFPWQGNESKSTEEVRDSWLSLAKSTRTGLARLIENERLQGPFLDKTTFATRMKLHSESFPWEKLADFLDFGEMQT